MGSNFNADNAFSKSGASGESEAILLREDGEGLEGREPGMHASQRRQGDGFLLRGKRRRLLLRRKGR